MDQADRTGRVIQTAAALIQAVSEILGKGDPTLMFDADDVIMGGQSDPKCGIIRQNGGCTPSGAASPHGDKISLAELRGCLARASRLLEGL